MFHEIRIDGKITGLGTHVYVDDKEIRGVRGVDYHVAVDEVSTVTLEVIPEKCNLDVIADLELSVNVDSLHEAVNCLQLGMLLDDDFKKGVIASTRSVLDEAGMTDPVSSELAAQIVERVFSGGF